MYEESGAKLAAREIPRARSPIATPSSDSASRFFTVNDLSGNWGQFWLRVDSAKRVHLRCDMVKPYFFHIIIVENIRLYISIFHPHLIFIPNLDKRCVNYVIVINYAIAGAK